MDCESFQNDMLDWLERAPEGALPGEIDAHLKACGVCRESFERLREGQAWANALPILDPPAKLDDRILAAARSATGEMSSRVRVAPASHEGAEVISLWARVARSGPLSQLAVAAAVLLMVSYGFLELQDQGAPNDLMEPPSPARFAEALDHGAIEDNLEERLEEDALLIDEVEYARDEPTLRSGSPAERSRSAASRPRSAKTSPLRDLTASGMSSSRRRQGDQILDDSLDSSQDRGGRAASPPADFVISGELGRGGGSSPATTDRAPREQAPAAPRYGSGSAPPPPSANAAPGETAPSVAGQGQGQAAPAAAPTRVAPATPPVATSRSRSAGSISRGDPPAERERRRTTVDFEASEMEEGAPAPAQRAEDDSASGRFLLEQGRLAYQRSAFAQARDLLTRFLRLHPSAPRSDIQQAHTYLARSYARMGEPARAVPHFRAAGAATSRGGILLEFADALMRSGARAEADRMYQRAEAQPALATRARRARSQLRSPAADGPGMTESAAEVEAEAPAAADGL